MQYIFAVIIALMGLISAGTAYAVLDWSHQKTPVSFYEGHYHNENGDTIGAPAHSGGTDKKGCHNRSVPYHCH